MGGHATADAVEATFSATPADSSLPDDRDRRRQPQLLFGRRGQRGEPDDAEGIASNDDDAAPTRLKKVKRKRKINELAAEIANDGARVKTVKRKRKINKKRKAANHGDEGYTEESVHWPEPLLCVTGKRSGNITCLHWDTLEPVRTIVTRADSNWAISYLPNPHFGTEGSVWRTGHAGEIIASESSEPFHALVYDPFRNTKKKGCVKRRMNNTTHRGVIKYMDVLTVSRTSGLRSKVVTGDDNGLIQVHDAVTGAQNIAHLGQFMAPRFSCLRCVSESRQIMVGERQQPYSIRLYDLVKGGNSGRKLHSSFDAGGKEKIVAMDFSGPNMLYAASSDMTIRAWSTRDSAGRRHMPAAKMKSSVRPTSLLCVPDQNVVLCGIVGGSVEVWDVRVTTKALHKHQVHDSYSEWKMHTGPLSIVRVSQAAFASIDGEVEVVSWDMHSGKSLAKGSAPRTLAMCLAGSVLDASARAEATERDRRREDEAATFLLGLESASSPRGEIRAVLAGGAVVRFWRSLVVV